MGEERHVDAVGAMVKAQVNRWEDEVKCTFRLYLVRVNASALVSEYDQYVVHDVALVVSFRPVDSETQSVEGEQFQH